jgi:hypothetical protein
VKEKHKRETIFWQTFCYNGVKGKKEEGAIWAMRFSKRGWWLDAGAVR